MARAAGLDHVAAATGSTSERAVQALYGLPEFALIDMGDFVGGTLKYLRRHPIPRLTLAGGFAKLAKLAAGHLDLHSSRSAVDLPALAELLAERGAAGELVGLRQGCRIRRIRCSSWPRASACRSPTTWRCARARSRSRDSPGAAAIEVMIFDREGGLIGHARGW